MYTSVIFIGFICSANSSFCGVIRMCCYNVVSAWAEGIAYVCYLHCYACYSNTLCIGSFMVQLWLHFTNKIDWSGLYINSAAAVTVHTFPFLVAKWPVVLVETAMIISGCMKVQVCHIQVCQTMVAFTLVFYYVTLQSCCLWAGLFLPVLFLFF